MLLLAWREAMDNHDAAEALDDMYHTVTIGAVRAHILSPDCVSWQVLACA